MLFPKMSLCKVFMPGKNSSERPPALLVPSQLVRRTVLATASGNTWALPLTVLLVPTVHLWQCNFWWYLAPLQRSVFNVGVSSWALAHPCRSFTVFSYRDLVQILGFFAHPTALPSLLLLVRCGTPRVLPYFCPTERDNTCALVVTAIPSIFSGFLLHRHTVLMHRHSMWGLRSAKMLSNRWLLNKDKNV